jgi:hypothetical protein
LRLCDERGTTRATLAHAADDWDEGDFGRWLNHGTKVLGEPRYRSLLAFVAETGIIEPEDYDKVYTGISNFLGYHPDDPMRDYSNFIGHYIIHRYSLLAAGYILQGRLTITYDEQRKAFRTEELYRIQAEILTRIKSEQPDQKNSTPQPHATTLNFPRSGYFFARSPNSYVMISRKDAKHPHEPAELQTIYFDNIFGSGAPELMRGYLSDWHQKSFYSTRVVAHKVRDSVPDDCILTLESEHVNDVAVDYLTKIIPLHKYVFSFI